MQKSAIYGEGGFSLSQEKPRRNPRVKVAIDLAFWREKQNNAHKIYNIRWKLIATNFIYRQT